MSWTKEKGTKIFKIKLRTKPHKLSSAEQFEREAISQLRKSFDKYLMNLENVNSVFLGYKIKNKNTTNKIAIIVGVSKKIPLDELSPQQIIPPAIKTSYKKKMIEIVTDVISIGVPQLTGRRDVLRPALGGESIGQANQLGLTGTLGFKAKDLSTGKPVIVTASHVLTLPLNNNIISKPGSDDGGTSSHRIGETDISRCVPNSWVGGMSIVVDAGLVFIDNVGDVDTMLNDVPWCNKFEFYDNTWDMLYLMCIKSGRTTGVTTGALLGQEGFVSITTPVGIVNLEGVLLIVGVDPITGITNGQIFTQPGDSGSLVITNPHGCDVGIGTISAVTNGVDPNLGIINIGHVFPIDKTLKFLGIDSWSDDNIVVDPPPICTIRKVLEPIDRDLLSWFEKTRDDIQKTKFGKQILDGDARLRKAGIVKFILSDSDLIKNIPKLIKIGQRLYKSEKYLLTQQDLRYVDILFKKLKTITSKQDLLTLKTLHKILMRSEGKNLDFVVGKIKNYPS